jgi:AraC-like DNA-binding protein
MTVQTPPSKRQRSRRTGSQAAATSDRLAEVTLHVGFSDQSQLSHHFKRLVGVTPGQFRTPSRIA